MRAFSWVGVISTLLTVLMAWPVVQQPNELLFGHEIVGRHIDAYSVIQSFDDRAALGGTTQPGVDWLGYWLAPLVGRVAAFNLLVLASFPLTAMAVFALATYLGIRRWPSVWASMLYAFSPLHIAHSAYHPHVAQTHWLPLVLLVVVAASDRWTSWRALAMASTIALAALTNFYAVLILIAVLPLILWVLRRHPVGDGEGWRPTFWTLIVIAVLALFFVGFYHGDVVGHPWRLAFPAADAQKYSAAWFSYLVPAVDHPLAGGLAGAVWNRVDPGDALVEQQLYLGWSILVLAALGVLGWRRAPGLRSVRAVPLLAALGIVALVLSLSPVLSLGPVLLPTPSWLLRAVAPMFRAFARFGFLVQLAVLLLAALAVSRRSGWLRRRWVVGLLLAVSLVEFLPLPPWRAHPVYPNAGYLALRELDTEWSVLDCTLKPQVQLSVVSLVEGAVHAADGDTLDCGEPDLAAKLAGSLITHVIDRADGPMSRVDGLVPVESRDGVTVYAVEAQPAAVYVRRWEGFSWREGSGPDSLRWAGTQPALWLRNRARRDLDVTLGVELVAFPEPREVDVVLNGDVLATLEVPGARTWFDLELPLDETRNRLQFQVEGRPVSPDQVLGNGDRRLLALGVVGMRYPRSPENPADDSSIESVVD